MNEIQVLTNQQQSLTGENVDLFSHEGEICFVEIGVNICSQRITGHHHEKNGLCGKQV